MVGREQQFLFTSDEYEVVIKSIRKWAVSQNLPLWQVEQYWRGYQ
jgi:hypothetical protein